MPMSMSWMICETSEFLPGLFSVIFFCLVNLPHGAGDLGLAFHEVDLCEDLFFAEATEFVIFIIAHLAALALSIIKRRTAVLCKVVFSFVNH